MTENSEKPREAQECASKEEEDEKAYREIFGAILVTNFNLDWKPSGFAPILDESSLNAELDEMLAECHKLETETAGLHDAVDKTSVLIHSLENQIQSTQLKVVVSSDRLRDLTTFTKKMDACHLADLEKERLKQQEADEKLIVDTETTAAIANNNSQLEQQNQTEKHIYAWNVSNAAFRDLSEWRSFQSQNIHTEMSPCRPEFNQQMDALYEDLTRLHSSSSYQPLKDIKFAHSSEFLYSLCMVPGEPQWVYQTNQQTKTTRALKRNVVTVPGSAPAVVKRELEYCAALSRRLAVRMSDSDQVGIRDIIEKLIKHQSLGEVTLDSLQSVTVNPGGLRAYNDYVALLTKRDGGQAPREVVVFWNENLLKHYDLCFKQTKGFDVRNVADQDIFHHFHQCSFFAGQVSYIDYRRFINQKFYVIRYCIGRSFDVDKQLNDSSLPWKLPIMYDSFRHPTQTNGNETYTVLNNDQIYISHEMSIKLSLNS